MLNQKELNKKNKRPRYELAEQSKKFEKALNGILTNGGNYVLLGNYPDLPLSYIGNDIDILVSDIDIAAKAFKSMGFVIRQQQKHELRAFIYIKSKKEWVAVDVETIASYSDNTKPVLKYILGNAIQSDKNGLQNPPRDGLLVYKTLKYIVNGFVHSKYQLQELSGNWQSLESSELEVATCFMSKINVDKETRKWIDFIVEGDIEGLSIHDDFYKYIDKKRNHRHDARLIYQGNLNVRNLFSNYNVLFSFISSIFIRSKYPLPAMAIVGNDGSGKTSLCQKAKDELYKFDPLHIVMRGNESWLPGWNKMRSVILGYVIKRKKENRKIIRFIVWTLGWIGEIGDFIDRWYRYKMGMAWANAGFGFVLFERYPTDRLRGEYPGPKWSLFPLEQFIPMPDVIVLLDVTEEDSLKRKPHDGHTFKEMNEKRNNYLKLIKDITPSLVISPNLDLYSIQQYLSELVWDYSITKQRNDYKDMSVAKWTPDKHSISDNSSDRKVKGGFR